MHEWSHIYKSTNAITQQTLWLHLGSEMNSFSERMGLKKVRTEIQVDSMDTPLRNRLWNALDVHIWAGGRGQSGDITAHMRRFLIKLMHRHYKEPIDILPGPKWSRIRELLRVRFFQCEWHSVYDFIEFVGNNYPDAVAIQSFKKSCKEVLEQELSAYRFVGKQIAKITSKEEISEIEEALETPLDSVRTHLANALTLMSDRKAPDHRNSIKESISAVEAICRLITKKDKATLGQALKEVETKIPLHGALKEAFSNLYGYTSSAEGIRHALLEESTLSFEDAKFMLVSCSAFINYLVAKVAKAGIKL